MIVKKSKKTEKERERPVTVAESKPGLWSFMFLLAVACIVFFEPTLKITLAHVVLC